MFSNEMKDFEIGLFILSESASLPRYQIVVKSSEEHWVKNVLLTLTAWSWIRWLSFFNTGKQNTVFVTFNIVYCFATA